MIKKQIKTLLKIHTLSIEVRDLLKKLTGVTLEDIEKEKEKNKWMDFQKDYIKLVEDHDLTIENEMFWAVVVLNIGVHRIFDIEAEYNPKLKKYGMKSHKKAG